MNIAILAELLAILFSRFAGSARKLLVGLGCRWYGRPSWMGCACSPALSPVEHFGRILCELRPDLREAEQAVLERIKRILDKQLADGDKRLLRLWRQIPESLQGQQGEPFSPLDCLRYLLARLMADWPQ